MSSYNYFCSKYQKCLYSSEYRNDLDDWHRHMIQNQYILINKFECHCYQIKVDLCKCHDTICLLGLQNKVYCYLLDSATRTYKRRCHQQIGLMIMNTNLYKGLLKDLRHLLRYIPLGVHKVFLFLLFYQKLSNYI